MAHYIGIMSGTSLDGVDIALCDIKNHSIDCQHANTYPLPDELATQAQALSAPEWTGNHAAVQQLEQQLGHYIAHCSNHLIDQSGIARKRIKAIGLHGITVQHQPDIDTPFSLQVGDASLIAQQTQLPVISDFRKKNIIAGGQGAPLAPAFHACYLADKHSHRSIINIGGIANITQLSGSTITHGYDTGPGNTLIDQLCQRHFQLAYDKNGEIAQSGDINHPFLQQLNNDPYFSQHAPKSTGKEYFNWAWLESALHQHGSQLSPTDMIATLTELTALSIAQAVTKAASDSAVSDALYICGGGAHNQHLMQRIAHHSQRPTHTTTSLGIDPDWVEAMLIAWLARQYRKHTPTALMHFTGAQYDCVLGTIHRPEPRTFK